MILVQIQGVPGNVKIPGYDRDKWFVAESMSFGVGKSVQASDSGKDIEIGRNEEQELSIDKNVDTSTVYLMHLAMKGRSATTESGFITVDIHMVQSGFENGEIAAYLKIRIENAIIKEWEVSADNDERPTESLRIWFNKSAMKYRSTQDGATFSVHGPLGWDDQANIDWKPQRLLGSEF